MGGPARPGAPIIAGNDLRYNLELTLEEAFKGKQTSVRRADIGALRRVRRHRRGERLASGELPDLPRPWPRQGTARLLPPSNAPARAATAPAALSRTRAGSAAARQCAQGEDPRGHPSRPVSKTAHASAWQARASRHAWRGGWRSYIFLAVKPHRFFQRDGANIQCRVPIAMPTATWAAPSRSRPSMAAEPGSTCRRAPRAGISSA